MPTIIGAIFFLFAAYYFSCEEDGLFGLLLVAGIFEAASAVNIAERGVQPYYIVALFIIARALINRVMGTRPNTAIPYAKLLITFGFIAIFSAFLLPIVFSGVPIYDPKIGIDDGLFVRPPLTLGLNNVAQAGYLAVHIATAFSLVSVRFSAAKTRRAFLFAFYFEFVVLCAQSFCQLAGISFPLSLFLNNPGYALWENSSEVYGTRNPGTFSEPSLVGAFLVLYCVGFLADYLAGKGKTIKPVVALIGSGLVASSSSLAILLLSPFVLVVRYFPFRPPWYLDLRRGKKILWMLFILIAPSALVLVASSKYRDILTTLTVSKGDSGSFINRTASDLYGLQLLIQTHGLGVGLGSSRSSSLITTLLSNIGVLGTVPFLLFFYKVFSNLPEKYVYLKWGGFALFLNMCLGIADVTMPLLWCPILLAIQLSSQETTAQHRREGAFAGILTGS
ncbi:MAG: hypothetical protein M3Y50_01095 [Acidobacteriota bacterium]|nr:hypothetical protein [Acidobacteriota bacterium]